MMKTILAALLVLVSATFTNADVLLTFDSDTEGFDYDGGTGTVTWADVGGEGMLRLQSDGGWEGALSKLDGGDLGANGGAAEIDEALANGGNISFDILIVEADQAYGANPSWFELVLVAQGELSGWDQEILNFGLGPAQWPLSGGQLATSVSVDILPGAAAGDGNAQYDAADAWRNIYLGLNNDGTNVTNSVIYIDNLLISANAVPEPSSLGLIALAGLGLVFRRRR